MPRSKHNKGKVEEHKLKIQEIRNTLNVSKAPLTLSERVPDLTPVDSHEAATTSASQSGTSSSPPSLISYGVLITPALSYFSLRAFGQACIHSTRTPLLNRSDLLESG